MEVAGKYRAQGTPMGYRIDKAGKIASELTVGGEALLQLATGPAPKPKAAGASSNGSAKHGPKDYRSIEHSRLNRKGLKAGDKAPEFRLPRIDGGELSLADLRGGRVLLVLSDPHCGPCAELAPRLQAIHLERPDLSVLVVSRGDADENRTKAAELGLNFPIVLQEKWEVSLKYAMFATPIGYLIDEQGVLTSDVAVGIEPILALAGESGGDIALSRNGQEAVGAT
jgi:peroxiredoxin